MNKLKGHLSRALRSAGFFPLSAEGRKGVSRREAFSDPETLVDFHFRNFSSRDHPCRPTLETALIHLDKKPAVIIETGSSAWGTNSSYLFDSYVTSFGGAF